MKILIILINVGAILLWPFWIYQFTQMEFPDTSIMGKLYVNIGSLFFLLYVIWPVLSIKNYFSKIDQSYSKSKKYTLYLISHIFFVWLVLNMLNNLLFS